MRWRSGGVWLVAGAAWLATLVLNAYPVLFPLLYQDDFEILVRAPTLRAAWTTLWLSSNDPAIPLARLSPWLVIRAAGRPTAIPYTAALQGVLALLAGMGLVYLFVRRELGHPFYGLTAMIFFGVS